jgi:prepilin-type N-terminal cleavage/methylation domain-containing protein
MRSMTSLPNSPTPAERGTSLLELIVALTILAIGVLAVSQLFPAGSRVQVQDRLRTEATQFSREKIEQLELVDWVSPALTIGRHPAGNAVEKLASVGTLGRYYQVDLLAPPLDNLKRVTVNVTWSHVRACTLRAVTYLRK